jgi:hypothetical protein
VVTATFPEALLAKNQVGIEIAGNYVGDEFGNAPIGPGFGNGSCSPCIPDAQQKIGVTTIPRMTGGGAVSTLSGWDLPVYAGAKDPQAVFNLINLIESKQNMLIADNSAGWPPNDTRYVSAPLYDNFISSPSTCFASSTLDVVRHHQDTSAPSRSSLFSRPFDTHTRVAGLCDL